MLKLWRRIPNRALYLAGFLYVCSLMGFGFYLQYVKHQEPCPLCMVQRMIFIAILSLFLLAAVQGPKRIGAMLYAVLISLLSLSGVAVAVRHIWIQHLPLDRFPPVVPIWITCWIPCRWRACSRNCCTVPASVPHMAGRCLPWEFRNGHCCVIWRWVHSRY